MWITLGFLFGNIPLFLETCLEISDVNFILPADKESMKTRLKPAHCILLIAFCFLSKTALPQEAPIKPTVEAKKPKFEIVSYGIFAGGGSRIKTIKQPGTQLEYSSLITETNTIPLKLNIRFGIEYMVTGLDTSDTTTVTHVINHPPMFNPKTEETSVQFRAFGDVKKIDTNGSFWVFDEPFELVHGTYTFKVFHKGEQVLEKTFLVVPTEKPASAAPKIE